MFRVTARSLAAGFASILFFVIEAQPAACLRNEADLPNFGQVTGTLYRGGQPTSSGFAKLKTMGVGLIINFRDEPSEMESEKRQVESLGMQYIGIPWNAHDKLSSAEVAEFLETIREHPETKVFVHCKRGADRTGLMVAAYRIAVEHKKVADALSEMHQFHFAGFTHQPLARYVKELPGIIQNDPAFKVFAPEQMTGGTETGKTY